MHEGVKDALIERILAHAREWPLGDPLDPAHRVGALVSKAHFDKVCGYLERGATGALGGKSQSGTHVEPTVMDVAPGDARRARGDLRPGALGDDGRELRRSHRARQRHRVRPLRLDLHRQRQAGAARRRGPCAPGTVTVNSYGEGDISTPFGGYKQSGFGGRDNGLHAHDQYTQLKTIWIDLADDEDEAVD